MQSEIMSPADTLTSTITLTKNNTGVSDRGEYKCQLGSPNTNSKIDVEIFEGMVNVLRFQTHFRFQIECWLIGIGFIKCIPEY